ncbi:MAG: ComF family protein [Gemmatimonadales bacterium]|jgi:ComF family protein
MLPATRALALQLEALVLPQACLGCEGELAQGEEPEACCALCRHRMRRIGPPVCARCGQPLDRWSASWAARGSGPAQCEFCAPWPPDLAWAASAVWLEEGPARSLVYALKYGGWRIAARPMASVIVAALAPRLRGLDAFVPVPLGRTRLRERGHNQAALLADALGRATGVRVLQAALVRARETRTQTRLSPAGRWENTRGAFAASGEALGGMHVALVDDVVTTGATLGAAAQALAELGTASIGAVTFARALVPA